MLESFKKIILFLIIIVVLLLSFFVASSSYYKKNIFTITLNEKEMSCYYTEKYQNAFFLHASSQGYNSVENRLNEIDLKKTVQINILEQEVYYKDGSRKTNVSGWYKDNHLDYKTIETSKMELEIKRMNKVLYKGSFKKDISQYLNEKGRYYFHIYVTRKEGFLTTIKTHISFNVVVGGGTRE